MATSKIKLIFSVMLPMTAADCRHAEVSISTKPPPVELYEIGFEGTWKEFCDRTRIDREFPVYFEHDLKTIRLLICRLQENNAMSEEALLAFASYKYCLVMRHRFDELLDDFVEKLSLQDEEKKRILLRPGPVNISACYEKALPAFTKQCVGNGSPCFKLFRLILGRACLSSWLTTEDILSFISKICAGKYITDNIDWKSIFLTLNYGKSIETNSSE